MARRRPLLREVGGMLGEAGWWVIRRSEGVFFFYVRMNNGEVTDETSSD